MAAPLTYSGAIAMALEEFAERNPREGETRHRAVERLWATLPHDRDLFAQLSDRARALLALQPREVDR